MADLLPDDDIDRLRAGSSTAVKNIFSIFMTSITANEGNWINQAPDAESLTNRSALESYCVPRVAGMIRGESSVLRHP
jgi:hypothetical protein